MPSRSTLYLSLVFTLLSGPVAFAQEAGPPDGGLSAEDAKLLAEIQAATAPDPKAPPPPAAAPAGTAPAPSRGVNLLSNIFNPAMSANGLLLGSLTSKTLGPNDSPVGVQLQELELQFLANVDPYFSANLILSIPSGEGLEVEEGYIAAIPQPLGLGLRAGKIKAPFGRENPIHTHALPFVERSMVSDDVFGPEGLNEVGLEVTWLTPLPWYALLTVGGMDGANSTLFGSPRGKDFAGFASLKNVFDLNDDTTLEAGVSYTLGNNADVKIAQALGAHLVFKWRPAANAQNSSVIVALEGLLARKPASAENLTPPPYETAGFYGYLQVQLTHGWYVAGRFELLGHQSVETDVTMRQSAVLVFAPTEFSAFRLQLSVTEPNGTGAGLADPIVTGLLQVNFTIGAHPAHAY